MYGFVLLKSVLGESGNGWRFSSHMNQRPRIHHFHQLCYFPALLSFDPVHKAHPKKLSGGGAEAGKGKRVFHCDDYRTPVIKL